MPPAKPEPEKRGTGIESVSLDQIVLIYAQNREDALDLELVVNKLLAAYGVEASEDSRQEFTGSWFIKSRVELSSNVKQLVKDLKTVFSGSGSSSRAIAIPKPKRSVLKELELNIKRLEAIIAICGVLVAGLAAYDKTKKPQDDKRPEQPVVIIVVSPVPQSIAPAVINAEQDPSKAAHALHSVVPGAGTQNSPPAP